MASIDRQLASHDLPKHGAFIARLRSMDQNEQDDEDALDDEE